MLKVAYSPLFNHPVPDKHRFPMTKYDLIPEKLINEGTLTSDNLFYPDDITDDEVVLTHTPQYWHQLTTQTLPRPIIRAIGFEMSAALIKREQLIAKSTYQCACFALKFGISLSVSGGTHHAFIDRGEGFCILNDLAITANLLLKNKQVNKVLIIDLDVHQGNGTASIFANEPRVFTFSMHGAKNYPFRKQVSDLDIELANDTDDIAYLRILRSTLPDLVAKVRPDIILYQAGVDVLDTDLLGKLSLSIEGCLKRDECVLNLAYQHNIPIAITMGGGYSAEVSDVVEAHCNTFRLAKHIYA